MFKYRYLLLELTKRDILSRYRGSSLGFLWNFFNPLLMLVIYSFVFGVVFKAKWGVDTTQNFAVILFSGLIIHAFLAEIINISPSLISGNANYVKKVVFPLEILPLKLVLTSLFNHCISLGILFLFLIFSGNVPVTWIYYPIILFPLVIMAVSISLLLSSISLYIKDISHLAGFLSTILLFLSPIFYPLSAIPEKYHVYILANPLAYIIEQTRSVLIFGIKPNFLGVFSYLIISFLFLYLSAFIFRRLKKGFSDVV
ncbi:sugar ABC transporter permease [Vibrio sp. vnigr-6D03]|uniref:ABC transporter permease n=1 Tax=Vibrio sp. vnigr-6D03 TaxID=2058088 RepID=UPI000C33A454|nr:ABC transporter permease [Vibrio sp. vnigr-6D03]PKF77758.1 sugar ABC transporter permease [Vibrio sp. vnigr-6D03]